MPLSASDFIMTHRVTAGVVDPELLVIAIRTIVFVTPCGDDPGWSDLVLEPGGEVTIATPFGTLVPV